MNGPVKLAARAYTLMAVLFGWVLFRAPGLRSALAYMGQMLFLPTESAAATAARFLDGRTVFLLVLGILLCGPLQSLCKKLHTAVFSEEKTGWLQIAALTVLFVYDVVLLISNTYNPFIYFRF